MKLPNGYGSVTKLSGKRRKPYIVRKTTGWHYDKDKDKMVQDYEVIGYAATKAEGLNMLSSYNKNPFDIDKRTITFAEVFEKMLVFHFKGDTTSRSYLNYNSAFNVHLTPLHKKLMIDIRREELQNILDNCKRKISTKNQICTVLHQMYAFAMMEDIVSKDYSAYLTVEGEQTEEGEPFSLEAVQEFWKHTDDETVQIILMMCYSSFRILELRVATIDLENRLLIGGVKNRDSRERIAPIHDSTFEFWKSFKENKQEHFNPNYFRSYRFYPKLRELGFLYENGKKHTPHDCRHTFSWLADKYEIDEVCKHLLMGHKLPGDIEQTVYRHRTTEELKAALDLIKAPPS